MIVRIIRTFFGILLLPVAFATGKAFFMVMSSISLFSDSLRLLERGALAYLVFHIFIWRPAYIYVWGHEFVHVIATWICGGKVENFKVSEEGGGVVTSKTNFFIELSPYFVPIYTFLLALIYLGLKVANFNVPNMPEMFLFAIGVTLTFHFVMTSEVLRLQQPDILKSGYTFSFVLIFTSNLVLVMVIFSPIFGLSLADFFKELYAASADIYRLAYDRLIGFIGSAQSWYGTLPAR